MNDTILILISCISLIIALLSLFFSYKCYKKYELNMKKIGKGNNITEMLEKYVNQVNDLNKRDDQIIDYCNNINNQLSKCFNKVGVYRFDAFGNTKNELSFTLAILDRENNGVVINSIYGYDNSNVYAKPIINGKSKYNLSEEEKIAIDKAIN